jgi:hypothetical protein
MNVAGCLPHKKCILVNLPASIILGPSKKKYIYMDVAALTFYFRKILFSVVCVAEMDNCNKFLFVQKQNGL